MPANLHLRPGASEDAGPCGAICYEAFRTIAQQHNFPPDFPGPAIAVGLMEHLLARDDVFAVIAEHDGRIVGSNFLWEGGVIAGVGPITVDPALQNANVGRALMEAVLARARERHRAGVRLVQAAYHGRSLSLYTKLGFEAREPLSTLQGPPLQLEVPGCRVRPATTADAPACDELCMAVHGHARRRELDDAIARGEATVVERHGRLAGYATGIGFFGHALGVDNVALQALIAAAPGFAGPGFLLPTRNGELLRWCLAHGLRIVQPMTLMSLGLYNTPAGAFLPSILY